jgi:hypothetical protein
MDRQTRMIAVSLVISFLFIANAGGAGASELRVLFIGNSLTYWNDLPSIIQALAKAGKQSEIHVESISFPDHSLEDHWSRGDALRAINKGKWDVVVLQQGPSASATARAGLIRYAAVYADAIRKIGAKPALYSVWPSRIRQNDLKESIRSYELAARKAQAMLIPAGNAWRLAWQVDPDLELYDPDGLHPSTNGSYLAALVFYEMLFAKGSDGLPSKLKLSSRSDSMIEIDPTVAKILQQAASAAVK